MDKYDSVMEKLAMMDANRRPEIKYFALEADLFDDVLQLLDEQRNALAPREVKCPECGHWFTTWFENTKRRPLKEGCIIRVWEEEEGGDE